MYTYIHNFTLLLALTIQDLQKKIESLESHKQNLESELHVSKQSSESDKLELGIALLSQGASFLKHTPNRRPHQRFVFLSKDRGSICWHEKVSIEQQ